MFSNIFKILFFSVNDVDMVTSKYCQFGYARICGNIFFKCVKTNAALLCAPCVKVTAGAAWSEECMGSISYSFS